MPLEFTDLEDSVLTGYGLDVPPRLCSRSLVPRCIFCVDVHACDICVHADAHVRTCACLHEFAEARGRYQVSLLVALLIFPDEVSH